MGVKTRQKPVEQMSLAYGEKGWDSALSAECLEEIGDNYTTARDRFADMEPGISVRESVSRRNDNFFRPGEAIPRQKNGIITVCDRAYRENEIVKSAIDMMADFVAQGIQVYHPAKSKENLYRHWFRKVDGKRISERLVNLLYRHGVAIIKKNLSDLNIGDLDDLETGVAGLVPAPDVKYKRNPKSKKNRIPMHYTFLNPITVDVIGGELAMFGQSPANPVKYGLRIPDDILRKINNPKTPEEQSIVANLPPYIMDAVNSGRKLIPIDDDKIAVNYYKKDDWQLWPDPMVMCILRDIHLYEKMKDADKAALDGSINQIRIWKLGLPEHKIQPGKGAFKKLRDQLLAARSGGSMDLIWDATLNLDETSTDVYKFLGSEKYEPVRQAICAGLGIPQGLGSGGKSSGMTNNALSLKTLIERLQYARDILIEFWEKEFFLLQQAFGHRQPAKLRFDMMSLSDEAAEKMIWIQLFDRNIVTMETMRERFGMLPEVETQRLRREYQDQADGDMPPKIGPFTEAQPHPDQIAKAAMTQGLLAPSEAGVKRKPKAKGDKSALDIQTQQADKEFGLKEQELEIQKKQGADIHKQKLAQNDDIHKQNLDHKAATNKVKLKQASKQKPKVSGTPGQGRPVNSKDTGTRKQRTPKPRTSASLISAQIQGRYAQKIIADTVTPLFLAACNKKNLRGLTSAESNELESLKFRTLWAIETDSYPDMVSVKTTYDSLPAPDPQMEVCLNELVMAAYGTRGDTPSVEELRELQVSAYALHHINETENDNGDDEG